MRFPVVDELEERLEVFVRDTLRQDFRRPTDGELLAEYQRKQALNIKVYENQFPERKFFGKWRYGGPLWSRTTDLSLIRTAL